MRFSWERWAAIASLAAAAARTRDLTRAYDAISPRYEIAFGDLQRRRADHMMKVFRGITSVGSLRLAVDLGCGTGILTRRLGVVSERVIGIDRSEGMLREARKRTDNPRCSFRRADLLAADDLRGSAELVTCLGVTSHIPPGRYADLAEAVARRIAPGGVGILGVTAGPWRSLLPNTVWRSRTDQRVAAVYNGLLHRLGIAEQRDPHVVRSLREVFTTLGCEATEYPAEDGLTLLLVEKRVAWAPGRHGVI